VREKGVREKVRERGMRGNDGVLCDVENECRTNSKRYLGVVFGAIFQFLSPLLPNFVVLEVVIFLWQTI
jgi:hypothetical protein